MSTLCVIKFAPVFDVTLDVTCVYFMVAAATFIMFQALCWKLRIKFSSGSRFSCLQAAILPLSVSEIWKSIYKGFKPVSMIIHHHELLAHIFSFSFLCKVCTTGQFSWPVRKTSSSGSQSANMDVVRRSWFYLIFLAMSHRSAADSTVSGASVCPEHVNSPETKPWMWFSDELLLCIDINMQGALHAIKLRRTVSAVSPCRCVSCGSRSTELMNASSGCWSQQHKVNHKRSRSVFSSARCRFCHQMLRPLDPQLGWFNEHSLTEVISLLTPRQSDRAFCSGGIPDPPPPHLPQGSSASKHANMEEFGLLGGSENIKLTRLISPLTLNDSFLLLQWDLQQRMSMKY